ncbi:Methionyl-tRNA formyltransferase [Corynebacterium kalinowskii]|uniref:Methionyl-tRNA formyltransferase n=1 Tax=Corynebacterium kalinowskii TaxID=2675216 RepID=A0A6B8VAC8_9CORY|nr:methionyl-tRNA formyltransferase [Corynebacterium kalinowskii]QGU02092.1 Methionyl-tRNA formyltransferase [Corynebacterium kalinowskii]
MKLVFAGTPEPATVALQRLIDSDHEVIAVITRPDARKGRGRTLHPSPVAALAAEHGIEVHKPTSLKPDTEDGQAIRARLEELQPDCIPVVAYGNLVTKDLLDIAPHGWVNLHFSLLPAWRGAAPVQAAIVAGDDITGATTFRIEEGLDTGPILGTLTQQIKPTDTADTLLTSLAHSGAELLVATMDGLETGALQPMPQSGEPTYAAKITKDDARINWNQPDFAIDRMIRGYTPAPGPWTELGAERYKIGAVQLTDSDTLQPGQINVTKNEVAVGTGSNDLIITHIQPPGKKMMPAADWARGAALEQGQEFTS